MLPLAVLGDIKPTHKGPWSHFPHHVRVSQKSIEASAFLALRHRDGKSSRAGSQCPLTPSGNLVGRAFGSDLLMLPELWHFAIFCVGDWWLSMYLAADLVHRASLIRVHPTLRGYKTCSRWQPKAPLAGELGSPGRTPATPGQWHTSLQRHRPQLRHPTPCDVFTLDKSKLPWCLMWTIF